MHITGGQHQTSDLQEVSCYLMEIPPKNTDEILTCGFKDKTGSQLTLEMIENQMWVSPKMHYRYTEYHCADV